MDRALDAKARLEALHQPVPRPTRAALELNKKEEASRQQAGTISNMLGIIEKHPDVAKASHVGEPTLVDAAPVTATDVVRRVTNSAGMGGDNKLSVETTNGTVAPNQEAPRSDAPTSTTDSSAAPAADQPAAQEPAAAELKPNVTDPNELKPNVAADPNALPPLQQSNQLENGGGTSSAVSSTASAKNEEMADISSSKKKKKKGLGKLNPF
jgi:outer membrane protein assembly factor BamD